MGRDRPWTELFVAMVGLTAVLVAAGLAEGFTGPQAWTFVAVLAAAYIVSRGLSNIGRGDGRASSG